MKKKSHINESKRMSERGRGERVRVEERETHTHGRTDTEADRQDLEHSLIEEKEKKTEGKEEGKKTE